MDEQTHRLCQGLLYKHLCFVFYQATNNSVKGFLNLSMQPGWRGWRDWRGPLTPKSKGRVQKKNPANYPLFVDKGGGGSPKGEKGGGGGGGGAG